MIGVHCFAVERIGQHRRPVLAAQECFDDSRGVTRIGIGGKDFGQQCGRGFGVDRDECRDGQQAGLGIGQAERQLGELFAAGVSAESGESGQRGGSQWRVVRVVVVGEGLHRGAQRLEFPEPGASDGGQLHGQ